MNRKPEEVLKFQHNRFIVYLFPEGEGERAHCADRVATRRKQNWAITNGGILPSMIFVFQTEIPQHWNIKFCKKNYLRLTETFHESTTRGILG